MTGTKCRPSVRKLGICAARLFFLRPGLIRASAARPVLPTGPTQIQISAWQNIPEVVALADVAAASDMAGLLADAGVGAAIEFPSLEEDWDRWTEPLVSIGGHFKTYRLLEVLEPKLLAYVPNDQFRVLKIGQEFVARDDNDYGLIVKAPHPAAVPAHGPSSNGRHSHPGAPRSRRSPQVELR